MSTVGGAGAGANPELVPGEQMIAAISGGTGPCGSSARRTRSRPRNVSVVAPLLGDVVRAAREGGIGPYLHPGQEAAGSTRPRLPP